jgi:hypothetical protein
VWTTLGGDRYLFVAWARHNAPHNLRGEWSACLYAAREFRPGHPELETRIRCSAHPGEDTPTVSTKPSQAIEMQPLSAYAKSDMAAESHARPCAQLRRRYG